MNVQVFVNGIISGSAIAMLALAFQLVYLPTRIFLISLAGVYSITPYIAQFFIGRGLHWSLASLLSVTFAVVLSSLFELCNHRRLVRKGVSPSVHMIAALGAYIVIVQGIAFIWGSDTKSLRTGSDTPISLFGIVVTQAQEITFLVCSGFMLVFYIFLMRLDVGLKLRALADNPKLFALFGHSINKYRLIVFAIAGFMAACVGLVTGYEQGFDPYSGLSALMLAVVAVIVGGSRSFTGLLIGALVLGLSRSYIAWLTSAIWQDVFTYLFLIIFLLFYPGGLFNRSLRTEENS